MQLTPDYELSPREYAVIENQREEAKLAREHAIVMKRMDIDLAREEHNTEITLKTLQAKWNSWLQIPILIIKLPLYLLFGIAFVCSMFTKKELPKRYWDFIS